MSKKEIIVVIAILIVIMGLSLGGFLVWNHYHAWKLSVDNQQAIATATPPSDSIPLTEAKPLANDSSNSLKVDTAINSNNPAQLGSGVSSSGTANNSSNSSVPANLPGPETFGQYDQYKTSENAMYADIVVGTGNEVKAGSKVAVYYKGWLTDGTLFDQSRPGEDGKLQPFVFTVGSHEVILGWEQDIVGMKVGGTRRMIIPPVVGYGEKGQGKIPGGAVLVFDVQLLAMQ